MSHKPTAHAPAAHTPAFAPTLRQVRPTLWRVLRSDGSMAGYIEQDAERFGAGMVRFEARRMIASTRQVVGVGDFSSIDDALSCFR